MEESKNNLKVNIKKIFEHSPALALFNRASSEDKI